MSCIVDALVEELCEMESLNKRQQAVRKLIDYVLARDDLLSKFVMALEDRGYQRLIDSINRVYPDKGTNFAQEYFAFIINLVKGQLLDILEPLQICAFLYENGCIEQNDKERIVAKHNSQGIYYACQDMLFAVKRRKHNSALLFVNAIKETQEHVKIKLDLLATKGWYKVKTLEQQICKQYNKRKLRQIIYSKHNIIQQFIDYNGSNK
ncbi:unnamed protein product [Mytilus edulis]|uniref:Caspase recruitment domain-containing protein n=1 Tax=Mytilus edulis TaxID=6550 RepID=A0A8S3TMN2_MYTED|nr:unnamed protein product [Mytilus edulis]